MPIKLCKYIVNILSPNKVGKVLCQGSAWGIQPVTSVFVAVKAWELL